MKTILIIWLSIITIWVGWLAIDVSSLRELVYAQAELLKTVSRAASGNTELIEQLVDVLWERFNER